MSPVEAVSAAEATPVTAALPPSAPLPLAIRSAQLVAAGIAFAARLGGGWLAGCARGEGVAAAGQGAAGRALVRACTRLGSTFIKVGQIASTRTDLLPGPLVTELRTLQDQVPPFSFETARAILTRELGGPPEERFARIDPEPLAAASVAQVHRAELAGGEVVAVKIRRPDVLEKAALDRAILLFSARVLERLVPSLRLVSLVEAVASFCDAVEEQLHLEREAANNARFQANFAGDPDVVFPKVYGDLSSDAILTMEFIDGVHEDELEARGVDVKRIVAAGLGAVCRMIFLHGFVHADLHPGNLRFLPPGRLALLDLGLVGELGDEDRLTTAQLLYALSTGDGTTVARLFYENAPHHAVRDYAAYQRDIEEFVAGVKNQGLQNLQVTLEIGRIFDILRRHRIQARAHMTVVNLALMTAEGMGKRLAPELDLTQEAIPYLLEAIRGVGAAQPTAERAD